VKKRNSAGQIVKRGKDRYLLRVYLGRDSTGKRHHHNETFHGGPKDAAKRLRELLAKHERGEPLKLSNDTLNAFIDEWPKCHPDLKESTISHYKVTIDPYVRPKLGNRLLTKIEANDIQSLYGGLREDGLSNDTLVYIHALLKTIFKLATVRCRIVFNPMDGVKSPAGKRFDQEKQEKREQRTMTPGQVEKFLTAANRTRFGLIYTLAFYTGCRPGELLGLRWDNLDTQARVLKIRQTLIWRKGRKWYWDTPKTATGRRNLRLTDELLELLERHRKRQLEERMRAGRAWSDHGFIFCNEVGEPYSQSQLRYFFKRTLQAAELPAHFNPYSARHTSGTLLMALGVNPKTVSERLGHSDVSITLRAYTHPTGEMHEAASERAEALIKGQK
jgi:integrase